MEPGKLSALFNYFAFQDIDFFSIGLSMLSLGLRVAPALPGRARHVSISVVAVIGTIEPASATHHTATVTAHLTTASTSHHAV